MEVQFGIMGSSLYPEGMPTPEAFRTLATKAEELGYDSIWVSDRIASDQAGSPLLEAVATLAVFAGYTYRIILGTSISLLPLRHPSLVGKQVASLDYLSSGRLVFGIGVGENPKDYEAMQVPYRERGARADESIAVLRSFWGRSPVSFEGRFFQFRDVWIEPGPVQQDGPPIWVGGVSQAALRRAGRLGDGWNGFMITSEQYEHSLDVIRGHAREVGRNPDALTPSLMIRIHADSDGDRARRNALDSVDESLRRIGRPAPTSVVENLIENVCAVGTPMECVAKLKAFERAGVRNFILAPIIRTSDLAGDCEYLFHEVVTPFRSS